MRIIAYGLYIASLWMPIWLNAQESNDHSQHDHSEHKHNHDHHAKVETSGFEAAPTLNLEVIKDSAAGWNLHLVTENFTFTPQKIDQDTNGGEGHAHVYVDGKKISRIYGPWFHLTGLTSGAHTIRISLNANNHSEFVFNGQAIEAIAEVVEE